MIEKKNKETESSRRPSFSSLEERKKRRRALAILFFATLFLSFLFYLWRLLPRWWRKVTEPVIVEFKKETPSGKNLFFSGKVGHFASLRRRLWSFLSSYQGVYGVYFYDLHQNDGLGISQEQVFPAASLIKLPVAMTLYQQAEKGEINLNDTYALREKDKIKGSGTLYLQPAGKKFTYRQLAALMLNKSDNTAQLILAEKLGRDRIQAVIDALGMKATSYEKGETTPKDIGVLFYQLVNSSFLSPSSREEILSFLTKTIFEKQIPAGLPSEAVVAHKVGIENGVLADAGVVSGEGKHFILVILDEKTPREEAEKVLPQIAQMVWEEATVADKD